MKPPWKWSMREAAGVGPTLYFVRHGETAWSITGQHTGHTDLTLTESGEGQARALAPWLRAIMFSHVFTSPMQRAARTCCLAGLDGSASVEPDLSEWNYGAYEGRRTSDIQRERPGWNAYRDGCPGGESPGEISARADRLIGHLMTLRGNIALFSHGQFGVVLVSRWIGLAIAEGPHFTIDTASLGILAQNSHPPRSRVIALWNAVPAMLDG
jgi:probable phosphoglycerate mutase